MNQSRCCVMKTTIIAAMVSVLSIGVYANTLDCTVQPRCYTYTYSFNENSTVTGMAFFLNGIQINNKATVSMNIEPSIKGIVDLNGGTLSLLNNLTLDGPVYNGVTSGSINVNATGASAVMLSFKNGLWMGNGTAITFLTSPGGQGFVNFNNQVLSFATKIGGGWSNATGFIMNSSGIVLQNADVLYCGDFLDGSVQTSCFRNLTGPTPNAGWAFSNCTFYMDNNMTFSLNSEFEIAQGGFVSFNSLDGSPYSVIVGASTFIFPTEATEITVNDQITLDVFSPQAEYLPQELSYIFNDGSSFKASGNFKFLQSRIQINGVVNFTSANGHTITFGDGTASDDARITIESGAKLLIDDATTVLYKNVD